MTLAGIVFIYYQNFRPKNVLNLHIKNISPPDIMCMIYIGRYNYIQVKY